jgi:predicted double-glycine peptidase
MSCGAASLSTLLTHDLHRPTSESEVVVWILRRTNPVKVQARGGFSLWDLKRFVASRGYKAEGYGDLTLQELADLHQPAIVPLQLKGYSHFVVFRGIKGDRVQYADPAFGNLTMTAARFASLWKGGIAFVVLPHGAAPQLTAADTAAPDAGSLYRNLLDRSIGHPTRLTP